MAEDITKTGAQSYRQLQRQNDETMRRTPAQDVLEGYRLNIGNAIAGATQPRGARSAIYQRTGGKDYVGNSVWDEDVYVNPDETTFDNTRGVNQWALAQLGAGIGKAVALAGTTFVDGTVGLLYGLGNVPYNAVRDAGDDSKTGLDMLFDAASGLFDNDVSNAINSVTEYMEQVLPNYKTDEENERPWYQNLGTANFWGDSFLKNLGFTVGAFYSGNAFNKILKGAGLLKSGIGASIGGSLLSAVNEGRIEANNTMHDYRELEDAKTKDAYDRRTDEILDSSLSDTEKNAMLEELDANYQVQLQDNAERSRRAGVIDLALNVPILTATNFYSLGRLYARGYGNAERKAAAGMGMGRRFADEDIASRMTRNADGTLSFKKYGLASKLWKTAKVGLSEGNEELAQQMASNFSGDIESYDDPDIYYKALANPDIRKDTMDFLGAFIKSFGESYLDLDQWEQFAVGALTGLMGMPTFGRVNNSDRSAWLGNGKPVAVSGGAPAAFRNLGEANRRGELFAEQINDFEEKYKKRIHDGANPFVLSKTFTDAMAGFSEDKDEFNFQNMADNDMFAVIQAYGQTGRLDDLASLIDMDFENMGDEQLEKIAKNTTTADNTGSGWKNADGSLMSDTEEGRAKMRAKLAEKRDRIKSQIRNYEEALEEVRGIGNNSLPDDAVQELAWLRWKLAAFGDRLEQVRNDNKGLLETLDKNISGRIDALRQEEDDIAAGKKDDGETIVYDYDIVDKEQYRLRALGELRKNMTKPQPAPGGQEMPDEEFEKQLQDAALEAADKYEKKMLADGKARKVKTLEANRMQRKDLADISDALDWLLEGVPSVGFLKTASDDKRMRELDNILGGAIYGDTLLGDNFTAKDFEDAVTAMRDALRIRKASETFGRRLEEYRKDPLAITRNRQRIDRENSEKKKAKDDIKRGDRIDNATVQDIVNGADDGEYDISEDDILLSESEGDSEYERKAKRARKAKVDAANGIRDRRKDAIDSLGRVKGRSAGTLRSARNMIDEASKRAERKEDVLDTEGVAWNDRNNLDGEIKKEIESLPEDQREARYIEEVSKAKEVAKELQGIIDGDEAGVSQFGSAADGAPDTNGKPVASFSFEKQADDGTEQEQEQKGGDTGNTKSDNGFRSSNDTEPNHDPGDPVPVGDEVLRRKPADEKRRIVKERILNDPDTYLPEDMSGSMRDSLRPLVAAAISMRGKGMGFEETMDTLKSLEGFAKLGDGAKNRLPGIVQLVLGTRLEDLTDGGLGWIGSGEESDAGDIAAMLGSEGDDNLVRAIEYIDGKLKAGKTRKQTVASLRRTNIFKRLTDEWKSGVADLVDAVYDRRCLESNPEAGMEDGRDKTYEASAEDAERSQDSMEKAEASEPPIYDYWKPTTTEAGMHNQRGDLSNFYDVAQRLNGIIAKINAGEKLTEDERRLRDAYLDPKYGGHGRVRWPYTAQQLRRMKAIYDYFGRHDVFGRLNRGMAGVETGSTVRFVIDGDLNEEAGEVVILIANERGEVIGDLMMPSDKAQGRQAGLRDFEKRIVKEWEDAGKPGKFTSALTTTIAHPSRGRVPFTSERHSVKQLDIGENFVAYFEDGNNGNDENDGKDKERKTWKTYEGKKVSLPPSKKRGQPFLLIKDACGTQWTGVPFHTREIDDDTPSDTPLMSLLSEILRSAASEDDNHNLGHLKAVLRRIFVGDFNITNRNGWLTIRQKTGKQGEEQSWHWKLLYSASVGDILEDPVREARNAFHGMRMGVNPTMFGKTFNIEVGNDKPEYNEVLAGEAMVNLPSGHGFTVNNWFVMNPASGTPEVVKAHPVPADERGRHAPLDVEYGGVRYPVAISDSYDMTVWDIDYPGELSEDTRNILRAHAYGLMKGYVMDYPYETPLGWYDPRSMRFCKKPHDFDDDNVNGRLRVEAAAAMVSADFFLPAYAMMDDAALRKEWSRLSNQPETTTHSKGLLAKAAMEHILRTYDDEALRRFVESRFSGRPDVAASIWHSRSLRAGEKPSEAQEGKQEKSLAAELYEKYKREYERNRKIGEIRERVGESTANLTERFPGLTRKYAAMIEAAYDSGNDFSWDDMTDRDLGLIVGILGGVTSAAHRAGYEDTVDEVDSLADAYRKAQEKAGAPLMPTASGVLEKMRGLGMIRDEYFPVDYALSYDPHTGIRELSAGEAKELYDKAGEYLEAGDEPGLMEKFFGKDLTGFGDFGIELPSLRKGVRDGKLSVGEAMVFAETLMGIHGDERARFFGMAHPAPAQERERDYDKEAGDAGLFRKVRGARDLWDALDPAQKRRVLDEIKPKDWSKVFDDMPDAGADEAIGRYAGRNLLATEGNRREPHGDMRGEVASIARWLPQLGMPGAVRLTHSLIRVGENRYAYGRFADGAIVLSDAAIQGTAYHEAFHYVFHMLMTDGERGAILGEARKAFGDLGDLELEERLAEDFRKYSISRETEHAGAIRRFFRRLLSFVRRLASGRLVRELRNPLEGEYSRIWGGKYKARDIRTNLADRRTYGPVYDDMATVAGNAAFAGRVAGNLGDRYAKAQREAWEKAVGKPVAIDGGTWRLYDGVSYGSWQQAYRAIPAKYAIVADVFVHDGGYGVYVMDDKTARREYADVAGGLGAIARECMDHVDGMRGGKTATRGRSMWDDLGPKAADDVRRAYWRQYDYGRLSPAHLRFLGDRKVSREEYETMPYPMREVMFKCMA